MLRQLIICLYELNKIKTTDVEFNRRSSEFYWKCILTSEWKIFIKIHMVDLRRPSHIFRIAYLVWSCSYHQTLIHQLLKMLLLLTLPNIMTANIFAHVVLHRWPTIIYNWIIKCFGFLILNFAIVNQLLCYSATTLKGHSE